LQTLVSAVDSHNICNEREENTKLLPNNRLPLFDILDSFEAGATRNISHFAELARHVELPQ